MILFTFILTSQIVHAVTLYPYQENLGNLNPGQVKTYQLTMFYNNETVDLSSNLDWIYFQQTHFEFQDQGSLVTNYTLVVPPSANPGSYTFTIFANSTGQNSYAIRDFNIPPPEQQGLSISYEGLICPGKSIFFVVKDQTTGEGVSGTLIAYTSTNEVITGGPLQITNGYTKAITIPIQETSYIMVKAEATGYQTTSKTFVISPNCAPAQQGEEGLKLQLILSNTNFTITGEPINITGLVKTNVSSVKDANCIYSGPELGFVTSGIGGICIITLTQSGDYIIWAEKENYIQSDPILITISGVTEEEQKESLFIKLILNSQPFSSDSVINPGDTLIIKLVDRDFNIIPINIEGVIKYDNSGREQTFSFNNGISDEIRVLESGEFTINIPETDNYKSYTQRFRVGGEFNLWWIVIILVAISAIAISAWLFIRKPYKKVGYGIPSEPEEFLEKVE